MRHLRAHVQRRPVRDAPRDVVCTGSCAMRRAAPTTLPSALPPLPPSRTGMAAAQVAAIVDGTTNFPIGGTQDGRWLEAAATAPLLAGNERDRLYAGTNY